MGDVAIESILEKYGTSGISVMLRTLHEDAEEVTANVYRPSATREMAEDLEEALKGHKEQTKG